MDFKKSTQARDWIFDRESLAACRRRAVSHDSSSQPLDASTRPAKKFASGFHARYHASHVVETSVCPSSALTVDEQEMLVRFHAHQIETLVGPTAILPQLRTSESVAATAITFFRRFYLSNSISLVHPRKLAVACAFFAAKVEEERVEVGSLQVGWPWVGDVLLEPDANFSFVGSLNDWPLACASVAVDNFMTPTNAIKLKPNSSSSDKSVGLQSNSCVFDGFSWVALRDPASRQNLL